MEHRKVGSSDLQLPVITFGAWAIGGLFWGGSDDAEAVSAMHAAMEHGIDAVDTAPMYGCGHSEVLVGKAIQGRRDKVKVLTKCGLRWDDTSGEFFFTQKAPDGSEVQVYKNLKASSVEYECEQSLRRLKVDSIDLYQVHWPSNSAPAEETMKALDRLRNQGKIRYIGVICYSPMAMGLLTGAVTMERRFPQSDVRSEMPWFQLSNRQKVLDALESMRSIADAHRATFGQLCVAWLLGNAGITTALVGARTVKQVAENARAGEIHLNGQERETIRSTFEKLGQPATAHAA